MLTELPSELLIHISTFLDQTPAAFARLARASRRLRRLLMLDVHAMAWQPWVEAGWYRHTPGLDRLSRMGRLPLNMLAAVALERVAGTGVEAAVYFEVTLESGTGTDAGAGAGHPAVEIGLINRRDFEAGWTGLATTTYGSDGVIASYFHSIEATVDEPDTVTVPYGPGDTIGCGYARASNTVFFTLNGEWVCDAPARVWTRRSTAHATAQASELAWSIPTLTPTPTPTPQIVPVTLDYRCHEWYPQIMVKNGHAPGYTINMSGHGRRPFRYPVHTLPHLTNRCRLPPPATTTTTSTTATSPTDHTMQAVRLKSTALTYTATIPRVHGNMVHYTHTEGVRTVQSSHHLTPQTPYYEVLLLALPADRLVDAGLAIGLACHPFSGFHAPGTLAASAALSSARSILCNGDAVGAGPVGGMWTAGTVIGCGYDRESGTVYWTFDGQRAGCRVACLAPGCLYPTLSSASRCTLSVNFGQHAFRYSP
ncbi:hypothetical protein BC831DRAFT_509017 [Entophlyctis helioformis]|nr:hypothetical protein BC831DRAFT_509017 [Entophlyctis helioformis]